MTTTELAEKRVLAAIGIGRILWGATTALAPNTVHKALGVQYTGPDQGIWIKAFGIRDILIGAAALHPDNTVRRTTLQAGIVMDIFDAAVVAAAGRRGLPRRATAIGILLATGAATLATAGPAIISTLNKRSQR